MYWIGAKVRLTFSISSCTFSVDIPRSSSLIGLEWGFQSLAGDSHERLLVYR